MKIYKQKIFRNPKQKQGSFITNGIAAIIFLFAAISVNNSFSTKEEDIEKNMSTTVDKMLDYVYKRYQTSGASNFFTPISQNISEILSLCPSLMEELKLGSCVILMDEEALMNLDKKNNNTTNINKSLYMLDGALKGLFLSLSADLFGCHMSCVITILVLFILDSMRDHGINQETSICDKLNNDPTRQSRHSLYRTTHKSRTIKYVYEKLNNLIDDFSKKLEKLDRAISEHKGLMSIKLTPEKMKLIKAILTGAPIEMSPSQKHFCDLFYKVAFFSVLKFFLKIYFPTFGDLAYILTAKTTSKIKHISARSEIDFETRKIYKHFLFFSFFITTVFMGKYQINVQENYPLIGFIGTIFLAIISLEIFFLNSNKQEIDNNTVIKQDSSNAVLGNDEDYIQEAFNLVKDVGLFSSKEAFIEQLRQDLEEVLCKIDDCISMEQKTKDIIFQKIKSASLKNCNIVPAVDQEEYKKNDFEDTKAKLQKLKKFAKALNSKKTIPDNSFAKMYQDYPSSKIAL